MKVRCISITIAMLAIVHAVLSQAPNAFTADFSLPKEIPGMKLVWSDEFNIDGKPDPKNWKYERGFVRNEELQWYQPDNANIKNGLLVIEGKHEQVTNTNYIPESTDWRRNRQYANYSSSSIISQGLQQFQYGRFEIRARIDTTMGSWPAIWMKGITGKWPFCGEIDIMEFYRDRVSGVRTKPILLANTAWGHATNPSGTWNTKKIALTEFTKNDPDWCEKFHVWRLDWTEDSINLYLDDRLLNSTLVKNTKNPAGQSPAEPFKQKHFILLNLAIGANGGIPVPENFPIKYEVDYVRVYQNNPTSTQQQFEKKIRIFPNHVKNFLTIESDYEVRNMSVFDLSGQLILKRNSVQNKIDLTELHDGFYVVKFEFYNGITISRRISKTK